MIIWQDLKVHNEKSNLWSLFKSVSFRPGFRLLFFYRLSRYCHKKNWKSISTFFFNLNHVINSCEISPRAEIGAGVQFPHSCGIVIGEGVQVGDYCIIYHNVTLGRSKALEADYPVIGDGVHIYSGASVLGAVEVGNNAVIGAHSLVIKDVPAYAVAVGIPAKIVKKKKPEMFAPQPLSGIHNAK